METSELVDWIIRGGLAGLGGLFYWYVKFKVPKDDARKDAAFQAKLKEKEDVREYRQETENVAIGILREMIKERSTEVNELRDEVHLLRQQLQNGNRRLDGMTNNIRALAGVIEKKLEATDGKKGRLLPK